MTPQAIPEQEQWIEMALQYLRHWMRFVDVAFTLDDFKIVLLNDGISDPPDKSAWGAVFSRAKREGTIRVMRSESAEPATIGGRPLWVPGNRA